MAEKKKSSSKNPRHAKHAEKQTPEQGTCFIIMPFGEWFDYYYNTIYIPAIKSTGLFPRRADDLYRPSAIVNDIWDMTQQAKVILADLSGKNPNVFYELGIAHALAKPAILVTETMDDIPFDLRSLRVIVYDKNEPTWGDRLGERIASSIKEILDSPLEAVLPTFLKVKESASKPTVTQAEKEFISMRQDIDLLKRELQARAESSPQYSRPPLDNVALYDFIKTGLRHGDSMSIIRRKAADRFGLSQATSNRYIRDVLIQLDRETRQAADNPPNTEDEDGES